MPRKIMFSNVELVTVMLATSWCWWLYDGNWFEVEFEWWNLRLVAELLCWRLFSLCWWFSECSKSVTNTFGLQHPLPTSMKPFSISSSHEITSRKPNKAHSRPLLRRKLLRLEMFFRDHSKRNQTIKLTKRSERTVYFRSSMIHIFSIWGPYILADRIFYI